MLEGNIEDPVLQQSIEEYIDSNVTYFLQEFCRENMVNIIERIDAKVAGILQFRPRQKVVNQKYIQPVVADISRTQEATDVIYQVYLEFIEKYYPEYKPISLGGFYNTTKDLNSDNKRSSWFYILSVGLRPGAIVCFKDRPQQKMKINTITPAGRLQLEGDLSNGIIPRLVELISVK
jgi:hypothetical protein